MRGLLLGQSVFLPIGDQILQGRAGVIELLLDFLKIRLDFLFQFFARIVHAIETDVVLQMDAFTGRECCGTEPSRFEIRIG